MQQRLGYRFTLKPNIIWIHICEYKYAVGLWLLLNILDYSLTQASYNFGVLISSGWFSYSHELNPILNSLSAPIFALAKVGLTMAAVFWLAMWQSLKYLKWLNIAFAVLFIWNVYDLIRIIL